MDLTPCAVVLARSRTSSAPFSVGLIEAKEMISMLFDMNTHFWFQGHSKRHAISTVRPGTGDQLEPNSIRSEHTLSYGLERRRARCVQPPYLQILCRVARASDAGDRGGGWLGSSNQIVGPSGFLVLDISQTRHSRREAGACPSWGWG